jgi:hypothetical protein
MYSREFCKGEPTSRSQSAELSRTGHGGVQSRRGACATSRSRGLRDHPARGRRRLTGSVALRVPGSRVASGFPARLAGRIASGFPGSIASSLPVGRAGCRRTTRRAGNHGAVWAANGATRVVHRGHLFRN